jgi:methionine sulfoxide reductase heme-binding subunit
MTHEFWYLSRAAGFTAYLALFGSVALGMMLSTRAAARTGRQQLAFDMHRFLSILALAFSLFHVYVLLGDQYLNFSVWQLSVPFASPYRTLAVATGVVSMYAMVLVVASFYVRKFIGYRTWRALHFITFAMYAGVTLHGITAGTDTTQAWARLLYLSTGLAVLGLLAYRLQYRLPQNETWRRARFAAAGAAVVFTAAIVLGTGLFAPASPAPVAAQNQSTTSASAAVSPVLKSFSDTVNGTYTQTGDANSSHLTVQARAQGDVPATLSIDLASQSRASATAQSQAVNVNKAQLLDPNSNAVLCDGQVTAFNSGNATVVCDGAGPYAGVRMTLRASLTATDTQTVTGALDGTMVALS